MGRCRRCGDAHDVDAAFCANCGAALTAADRGHAVADDSGARPSTPQSSEYVGAPAFGETSPPVVPATDTTASPTEQPDLPTAAASTTVVPGVGGPADATIRAGSPADDTSRVRSSGSTDARSASTMVAALAVAVVVIAGGILVLLVSSSGGDDALTTDSTDTIPSETAEPAPSSPTDGASSVPDTPSASTPASTDPPVSESIAPPTPAPTTPSGPSRGPGDLGLAQPILDEACDGRFITFVGSAVGDEPYPDVVSSLLAQYPGSNYIWTKSCPSLRQEFRDGSDIYGVVFGPYPTQQEACDAVSFGPPDAYVRRISTTDPPDHTVEC